MREDTQNYRCIPGLKSWISQELTSAAITAIIVITGQITAIGLFRWVEQNSVRTHSLNTLFVLVLYENDVVAMTSLNVQCTLDDDKCHILEKQLSYTGDARVNDCTFSLNTSQTSLKYSSSHSHQPYSVSWTEELLSHRTCDINLQRTYLGKKID